MNKTMVLFSMIISVLIFSLYAEARGKHCGKELSGCGMCAQVMEKLGLNNEQKSKLEAIRKETKNEVKKLKAHVEKAREKLQASFNSDAPEAELRVIQAEIKNFRSQLGDLRFEKILAMRKMLTAKQRKRFHELKAQGRGNKACRQKHRAKHSGSCEGED